MIGRTMLDKEEPVYHKYAEEAPVVSKVGLITLLKEQGEVIDQLTKSVQMLEDHLSPITVSHPIRANRDHDMNGDSEAINALRVHNELLIMLIDRIVDLRSHTQI
jgi:hypothetical protein